MALKNPRRIAGAIRWDVIFNKEKTKIPGFPTRAPTIHHHPEERHKAAAEPAEIVSYDELAL